MQKRKEAPKRAILDLRQQLDMLQKRERHLENQMAEQDVLARKYVATNKTGTLHTCPSSMDLLGSSVVKKIVTRCSVDSFWDKEEALR